MGDARRRRRWFSPLHAIREAEWRLEEAGEKIEKLELQPKERQWKIRNSSHGEILSPDPHGRRIRKARRVRRKKKGK